jgi:hypothetical protein
MAGEHSLLGPSSAHRWSRCVGSLLMGKGVDEGEKPEAASGTCTHYIAECMLNGDTVDVGAKLSFDGFDFVVDQERIDRAAEYVRRVNSEPGRLFVEQTLDLSEIYGRPGQKGTADAVKLDSDSPQARSLGGILSVHDFKDGYNRVDAKDNLQGMLYLAGALWRYDLVEDFDALRFVVHQPKINHFDEHSYSRSEIVNFVTLIRPVAQLAFDLYYGATTFDPAVHLSPGDEQCTYCPVRGSCPARARRIVQMFEPLSQRLSLDNQTLADIVARLDEIEQACKDFRAEALKRALNGRPIPGYKLVRGKKGDRKWVDPVTAASALAKLELGDRMYEPRELISPAVAQKLLKKRYDDVKGLVTQSEGSLHLTTTDDKRDEYVIPTFEESLV